MEKKLTEEQLKWLYEAVADSLTYDTEGESLDNEYNLPDGTTVYVCGTVELYWATYSDYHSEVHGYEPMSELKGASVNDLEIGIIDEDGEYPIEVTYEIEQSLEEAIAA